MSNLQVGFEVNVSLFEKEIEKEFFSKEKLLSIYGNLKVLEYRAFTDDDSSLAYSIQNYILRLEEILV